MQAQQWIEQDGRRPMGVAVNISAVEFRDPHFVENIRSVLRDTRLDPHLPELELTESVV